jgi:hypothetical protein
VRRLSVASLDSGAESPVYGAEPSATADREASAARPPWGGGGGRWGVWTLRAVLWAVILIVGYRGIVAIFFTSPSAPRPPPGSPWPSVRPSPCASVRST